MANETEKFLQMVDTLSRMDEGDESGGRNDYFEQTLAGAKTGADRFKSSCNNLIEMEGDLETVHGMPVGAMEI